MADRFINSLATEQVYSDSVEKRIATIAAQIRKKKAAIAKKRESVTHHVKLYKGLKSELTDLEEQYNKLRRQQAAAEESFIEMSIDD